MGVFQQVLWGYQLSYPEDWAHRTSGQVEGFAAKQAALNPDYTGPEAGQVLVSASWNPTRQPVEPLWNQHVAKLAAWLGSRQVGSAVWQLGTARGVEAEIQLPKKDERRLWTGILENGFLVLYFVVLHLKEERLSFEPLATQVISSLRFLRGVEGVTAGEEGLPLPPGYAQIAPEQILEDIADPAQWRAYQGNSPIDALQAFYTREAPHFGWRMLEYAPFPSPNSLGFARFIFEKEGRQVTLGVLPYAGEEKGSLLGRLAIKLG